jgi:ribonuclease T2
MRWVMVLALWAGIAQARGEQSGVFDYYVMALSWSASWCAASGDARGSEQCEDGRGHGWVLHGLWPQYETGWPSYCPTSARSPSRAMTRAMADIMGSSGSAWHQWRKHGVCAGMTAEAFYALSREAYARVERPEVFRRLGRPVRLPASVVEEAFLEANPALSPDMITVTCRDGRIAEARICLTRNLRFRRCGQDVLRDCRSTDALFPPMR